MTLTANVRLYGPVVSGPDAGIKLERDASSVDITATEWLDGSLYVYVDINDPEDGSSLDLRGTLPELLAFRDRLTLVLLEAANVPVEDRR